MEMKMIVVGFLVMSVFALPAAFAILEKDIITPNGVKMAFGEAYLHLDEKAITALTGKILISNPVTQEAVLQHSLLSGGGGTYCEQTCVYTPCSGFVPCLCENKLCMTD